MSMIEIHKRNIQGIPTLEVVPKEKEKKPLPCVLYYHGFTSAKEHNLPFAYMLAEKGYRILLPDSQYHGERYVEKSEKDIQLSFWNIVEQNIKEGSILYKYLQDNELLEGNPVGVAGTSMGGITTSSMITMYDWIHAAAIFMGTAKTSTYAQMQLKEIEKQGIHIPEQEVQEIIQTIEKTDLSKHLHVLKDKNLFMWHGEKDPVIPFSLAHQFYNEVKRYDEDQIMIEFKHDKDSGHKVNRNAFLAGADWFERNL